MVLSFKQAPDATLDLLLRRPELAVVFWRDPNYTPPETHPLLLWFARLFGDYRVPEPVLPEAPTDLARNGEELRIDRQVDRILALLSDGDLTQIGVPIPGTSHGHGDERAIVVGQIADLQQRVQANAPAASEPDDLQIDHERLCEFLNTTAADSLGLVVQLS